MSLPVLVSEIISDVETRCGLPVCTADTNVTATAMLRMVKQSAQRLSGLMTGAFGSNYFATQMTLATQAGLAFVSLPTNFATLLRLYYVSGGKAYPIEMAQVEDWSPASVTPQSWTAADAPNSVSVQYRLQGAILALYPCPSAAYTLSMTYTTGLFVTATSDTIAGQIGWDEWLTLDVCCRVRQREQKDYSEFRDERAIVEGNILGQAKQRDRTAVFQVRDDRGVFNQRSTRYSRWG